MGSLKLDLKIIDYHKINKKNRIHIRMYEVMTCHLTEIIVYQFNLLTRFLLLTCENIDFYNPKITYQIQSFVKKKGTRRHLQSQ